MNFRRKNVIGLSFDFVTLNITGFFAYSVFNLALMFNVFVRNEYIQKYGGSVPVEINDVVFALHALLMSLITAGQVIYYPKGDQKVSNVSIGINIVLWVVMFTCNCFAMGNVITWLSDVYIFSYVKLIITLVKYTPQAWSNFMRKSTVGWSIGGVLLDLTGGLLSFGQQFVDSINAGDWTILYGNPTKLGLSFISIAFDLTFMFQHYVLYRKKAQDNEALEPVETERINTSNGHNYNSLSTVEGSRQDSSVDLDK